MKKAVMHLMGLLIPALVTGPAGAWSHANYRGGSTSHEPGSDSTTRSNAWGGSETHTYGEGTTATGRYGGTATHAEGSGQTTATNRYGGTATHTYGQGTSATRCVRWHGVSRHGFRLYELYTSASGATAYHSPYYGATYPAYHPPVVVNNYGSGCYNCGGWSTAGAAAAGVVVGAAAGAAVASANTAAATSNAYNAGVVAGATAAAAPASTAFAMGAIYPTLPAGCITPTVQGRHILFVRQHVVQALLRRQRRLLPRGADAGLSIVSASTASAR
ncbi:hypothetical protein ACU4GD_41995 [Cupriavidus basilensis]